MRLIHGIVDLLQHIDQGETWAIVVLVVIAVCAVGIVILLTVGQRKDDAERAPMPRKRLRWPEDAPENKPWKGWKTKKPGSP